MEVGDWTAACVALFVQLEHERVPIGVAGGIPTPATNLPPPASEAPAGAARWRPWRGSPSPLPSSALRSVRKRSYSPGLAWWASSTRRRSSVTSLVGVAIIVGCLLPGPSVRAPRPAVCPGVRSLSSVPRACPQLVQDSHSPRAPAGRNGCGVAGVRVLQEPLAHPVTTMRVSRGAGETTTAVRARVRRLTRVPVYGTLRNDTQLPSPGSQAPVTSEMTAAECAPIRPNVSRLPSQTSTTPADHRTLTCPDTGFIP